MSERLGPARVLVVDDQPSVTSLLRELLTPLGYTVKTAATGEEALDDVETFEPDVVLLDLTLPGMPGAQVLDTLRQTHPEIRIVAMTGDPHLGADSIGRGAVTCLRKPFGMQTVKDVLRELLETRRDR
jgi:CheY-like chemotaxis protein